MLILRSSFISLLPVFCMIHFLYSWPETLDCTLSPTKFLTLPSSLVFQNSLHRQFIHIKYVLSRWSSGNRRRATSAREVIEVAGSNHAIGVILNLAWGPNNFSPSMIWNWRTRSNSRTGLGAEWLLPAKSVLCFCCLSYFFLKTIIFNFFFLCFFFLEKLCYWCTVSFCWYGLVLVSCFFSLSFLLQVFV